MAIYHGVLRIRVVTGWICNARQILHVYRPDSNVIRVLQSEYHRFDSKFASRKLTAVINAPPQGITPPVRSQSIESLSLALPVEVNHRHPSTSLP